MAKSNDTMLDKLTAFFRLQDVGTEGQAPGAASRPAPGQFENRPAPFRDRAAFEAASQQNRAPAPQQASPLRAAPTRLTPPPAPPAPAALRRDPLKKKRPLTGVR